MSHPKLYETRGAQYDNESQTTSFCLYAPNARNVSVILTAFGSEEHRLEMIKTNEGLWEIVTDKAQPGRTYLYLIDDYHGKHMLRTDPVSFSVVHISEVDQAQSIVHDETAYQWGDENWMKQRARTDPLRSPLSIYEIQPKSWKSGPYHSLKFRQIASELATYCRQMGFTHVEMYGILEHGHRGERGYQVANFFAPYRDSGTCDDLKYLIDHLHQNGIGVILDWIPTHFHHYHHSHQCSSSLHEYDGTNLYASTPSRWGTLYFDFDKKETRRLLFASALYYLDRLHIDAIRFDAVSQMIRRNQTDIPGAISFLRKLNRTIHTHYPGVLCIAEETEGYPNLTKTMGFDLKWNIGWSYDARNLLRTPYTERPQHWKQKVLDTFNWARWSDDKMILTLSHDDTDSGEHNSNNVLLNCVLHARNDMDKFADLRNFFAWQRCAPSRGHMIHMGDEVAQPMSWYQRFRQDLSSMDWSLTNSRSLHGQIQECIRDLNHLYIRYPQFWQYGEQDFSLIYEYGANLVIAYHRGIHNNRRLAVIHNFSNRGYKSYDIPLPGSDPNVARIQGAVEIFNTDHPKYGGSGSFQNQQIKIIRNNERDMLFRLGIPPLATIILEEHLA
jgi:1,4-alpha-glucan branching enzyme